MDKIDELKLKLTQRYEEWTRLELFYDTFYMPPQQVSTIRCTEKELKRQYLESQQLFEQQMKMWRPEHGKQPPQNVETKGTTSSTSKSPS